MMDKATEKQIRVGSLDPDLFTSTNISQCSQQAGKAISNAMMNNYYVVGAYYTSHWVIVIICEVQKGLLSRFCSTTSPAKVPRPPKCFELVSFMSVLFTKIQSLSVSNWYC
jgi:hypothetical protein